jgi:hypothetical protein
VVPYIGDPPALVLLTTDGYSNAFVNDDAFRKVATDILQMCQTEGWGFLQEQLPIWLEEASRIGSGDDVTAVLLIREDITNFFASASVDSACPDVNQSGQPTKEGTAVSAATEETI